MSCETTIGSDAASKWYMYVEKMNFSYKTDWFFMRETVENAWVNQN